MRFDVFYFTSINQLRVLIFITAESFLNFVVNSNNLEFAAHDHDKVNLFHFIITSAFDTQELIIPQAISKQFICEILCNSGACKIDHE